MWIRSVPSACRVLRRSTFNHGADVRWTVLIEIIRIHKAEPLRFNSATLCKHADWLTDFAAAFGSVDIDYHRQLGPCFDLRAHQKAMKQGEIDFRLSLRHRIYCAIDTYSFPGQRLCNAKLMMFHCKEICIEYNLFNQVVRWCPWLDLRCKKIECHQLTNQSLFMCVEGLSPLQY